MSYFKSTPSKYKTSCKKKNLLGLKTSYLCIFRMQFWKIIPTFEIGSLEFFKMQRFIQDEKLIPKYPICVFSRWNLKKKLLSHLMPASSNFSKWPSFVENQKLQIWDLKCLIWVFQRQEFEKPIAKFETNTQSFVQSKKLQIWDQKCLIWVFLSCNFEKLVSY